MACEKIGLLLTVLLMGSCTDPKEELITVQEKTETIKEGSCVTITCDYKKNSWQTHHTLLWFKDPLYDNVLETFNGTIVYSNNAERPQSPGYSSRVEFITDATSLKYQNSHLIKCDLRMTDLQKTDSGHYSFRFIGSQKYMSKAMKLAVTDNPCKVQIESGLMNPHTHELTVKCSTSGSCDSHPEWLVHTSGQKQEWISSSSSDMIIETEEKDGRKITTLKLKVTPKDDNRILSCRPAESDDSCQIRKITLSVDHAPANTTATVSSESVVEGDSVTLSCSSRGRPDVSFTWFKNETKEESQQMSDWTLKDVKPEDSGEYYCEAKNKHGKLKSNNITIEVKYSPKGVRVKPLVNVEDLKEGDELTLQCSVEKSNPPVKQFEWYKNNHVQEQSGNRFTINLTAEDDGGSYYCQASNGIKTEESNNITISVQYAPADTTARVSSESVVEGDSVTLSCSSRGRPDVSFTWFKNETKQESQQMSDWTLKDVKSDDSGDYYCEAKNKHGQIKSNNITIKVKYGPKGVRVKPLVNVEDLKEGDELTLQCSVETSNPPVKQFEWYKNYRVQQQSSNRFTINLTAEDDGGSYYCQANNGVKTEESNNITISVQYSPRNITIGGSASVKVGTSLTLTCSADANPEPNSYMWTFPPGLSSPPSSNTTELHIATVSIQHAGQYTCDVTNTIGTKSHNIDVDVLYPPSNLSLIMKSEVRQFELISIICSVQSFPHSQLTVTGPQGDLRNIQKQRGNSSQSVNKLTVFLNITESDDGEYKCKAENTEGKTESEQQLTVLYTTATVSSESVVEGDSVTLSCSSRGRPDVSFIWFKNETTQESQQMSDWTLNDVKPEDSGEYYCEAKNKHGKMKSNTITIDVKYGPKSVTAESEDDVNNLKEGNKLTLKCSVKESNPTVSHFTWYKNSNVLQQTGDRLIISQLKPDDGGTYYCQANNGIKSEKSNKVTVPVQYSPRNIRISGSASVKVGTSLTLTCSADANPEPNSYMWTFPPGLSSPPSSNTKKLHISTVTIQHSGQYTCDVTNTIGTRSHNIDVDVLYPPSNLSLIMKSEVREFELISIICSVQSFPHSQLTVTGPQGDLRNIQKQRGNSSQSVNKLTVFLNITESDDGEYKCKAENSEGKTESEQQLTVLYAPANTTATVSSESVVEGDSVTLSCSSRGRPDVSFTWFKNETKQESQQMSDWTLKGVKPEDSGEYYCEVKNKHGKMKSNTITIEVKYGPKDVRVKPLVNVEDLKEGDELTLQCSVEKSNPPVKQFEWYKNYRVQQQSGNRFTINLTAEDDGGSYYCQTNNGVKTEESNKVTISVQYAPNNVNASSKGEEVFGSELTLTCEAFSNPPSSYEWKKHLSGQLQTVGRKQKLHFHSLEVSDSGQYICIAQNRIGKTESQHVDIRVKYAPNITIIHNMTSSTQGKLPVSLSCSADAFPSATDYKWYREEENTTILSHQQNFTVQPQDPGTYYCTAANDIGSSQSNHITLFVSSNFLVPFIVIIIFLLLILIAVIIFLIYRAITKAKSDQQTKEYPAFH